MLRPLRPLVFDLHRGRGVSDYGISRPSGFARYGIFSSPVERPHMETNYSNLQTEWPRFFRGF
jgi:hypothetical protein